MNSTALGAEKENINFISEAHEKFYYEKIQKVREADVYHKALCYCIGMNEDTRRNVDRIYNFKTGCVKPECLHTIKICMQCLEEMIDVKDSVDGNKK